MKVSEMLADIEKRIELNRLKDTEAHLLQLIADAGEEEREMLMAKYRRTQARRMELTRAAA